MTFDIKYNVDIFTSQITAQFLELYNEEIIDLFEQSGSSSNKMTNSSIHVGGVGKRSSSSNTQSGGIRIHEDVNGNIYTVCDTCYGQGFVFVDFSMNHFNGLS